MQNTLLIFFEIIEISMLLHFRRYYRILISWSGFANNPTIQWILCLLSEYILKLYLEVLIMTSSTLCPVHEAIVRHFLNILILCCVTSFWITGYQYPSVNRITAPYQRLEKQTFSFNVLAIKSLSPGRMSFTEEKSYRCESLCYQLRPNQQEKQFSSVRILQWKLREGEKVLVFP